MPAYSDHPPTVDKRDLYHPPEATIRFDDEEESVARAI